jgi:hypothetical protein
MRTPIILVAGQKDADPVVGLCCAPDNSRGISVGADVGA